MAVLGLFLTSISWGTTFTTPNAYMVENTTGTDPNRNACYDFQTRPTCRTTIPGLVLSTGSLPAGSTLYIQNTLTPTTTAQAFNVFAGKVSSFTITANSLNPNSVDLNYEGNSGEGDALYIRTATGDLFNTVWAVTPKEGSPIFAVEDGTTNVVGLFNNSMYFGININGVGSSLAEIQTYGPDQVTPTDLHLNTVGGNVIIGGSGAPATGKLEVLSDIGDSLLIVDNSTWTSTDQTTEIQINTPLDANDFSVGAGNLASSFFHNGNFYIYNGNFGDFSFMINPVTNDTFISDTGGGVVIRGNGTPATTSLDIYGGMTLRSLTPPSDPSSLADFSITNATSQIVGQGWLEFFAANPAVSIGQNPEAVFIDYGGGGVVQNGELIIYNNNGAFVDYLQSYGKDNRTVIGSTNTYHNAGLTFFADHTGTYDHYYSSSTRKWDVCASTSTNANSCDFSISTNSVTGALLYVGMTSTVTAIAGTGAGTIGTPTASVTGTNFAGTLTVITATTPGTGATVATITTSLAAPTKLVCSITADNAITALASGATGVYVTSTASTWTVISGATGLTGASTYVWNYICGGY